MHKHSSIITTLSKDKLEELIKNSNSVSDIIRHFGLECDGANFRQLYKRAEKENLTHEIEKLKVRSKENHKVWLLENCLTKEEFEKFLILESNKKSAWLKIKLVKFDLLSNKCSECNLEEIWNGKKISLQLDHINGNRHDNRIENLRILCPNCHSQTDTYAGKRHKIKTNCQECGKICNKAALHCLDCSSKLKAIKNIETRKFEVSKEELLKLLETMPMTKIGKMFGVTDNSIRKRCLFLDIQLKPKKVRKSNQELTIAETEL